MAARKTTVRKKAKARRLPRGSEALRRIEPELPANLREYSRRVRRGLVKLERQIETAQRDARRRWTRLLREASQQLGRLEALGEKQWKKQTYPARREAVKLLRRLERALEPPRIRPARKRKAPARKVAPPRAEV
jgi:hypothetical protein